jgi:voltage-gated potassium channel
VTERPAEESSRTDSSRAPDPSGLGAPRTKPVRRRAARSLLSSGLVSTFVIVGYFLLPLSSAFTSTTVVLLIAGLVGLSALLAWHLRSILSSPYPRVRAVAALATLVPMFLVLFATAYFVMSRTVPGNFSEPLSRLDSAYYTVTVFATVGFGDITPVTSGARAATTLQMVGDVILVGLVAQVIVGAVRQGVRRRDAQADEPELGEEP